MRAESRLLVALVEISVFDGIFGHQVTFGGRLRQRDILFSRADPTVREDGLIGIEAEPLRHHPAQLHTRSVDA
ncbi:hypothetical protein D3C71_1656290 [compost metagenome]